MIRSQQGASTKHGEIPTGSPYCRIRHVLFSHWFIGRRRVISLATLSLCARRLSWTTV
ncbi:hypothetical protein ACRALDRAFT_2048636 [Sodiomyces alcalophilus JCM 7366]|uniref:uncharacterized protein n=1 Tax=Sodiomyces alcalophilus JCM 7366 TaxID=591952 RepID=UPI0039B6CA7B